MQQKKIFSNARTHSAETLAYGGNRLQLVMAILILLVTAVLYAMVQYSFYLLASVVYQLAEAWMVYMILGIYQILCLAIALFLVLPAGMGFYDLAGRMSRGEDTVLGDLFSPFSARERYMHALALSWGFFWRIGLTALAVQMTSYAVALIPVVEWLRVLLFWLLVAIEVLLGLYALKRFFWMPYLVLEEGYSPRNACQESRVMRRKERQVARVFLDYWFWWIVLGILSIGVLLLWDVLPRMTLSYFGYCRDVRINKKEKTIRTEDSIS